MNNFQFINHQHLPEDEYTKEIAFILVNGIELLYTRKKTKEGKLFWTEANVGITKDGKKIYIPGFSQDSKKIEKEIREFLDAKGWEQQKITTAQPPTNSYYPHALVQNQRPSIPPPPPRSMDEIQTQEEMLPF